MNEVEKMYELANGSLIHPQSIIDFMLKDSGQFTVEGHYYIYSKSVYAGGKTFDEALVNWWKRYFNG